MAKMFYSAKEASEKLGVTEDALKVMVRDGKLREFRDAGTVNYKVSDVDGFLAKKSSGSSGASKAAGSSLGGSSIAGRGGSSVAGRSGSSVAGRSASASGEIVLEPVEDSGISLASSGSDVMSLDGSHADETATGIDAAKKSKEGSSVPSVGINVFDDDELDEHVDPLAQTAVSDVAGLGLDGAGSGSGILDLTRESDDTSLGAELLEEIYTPEEAGGEAAESVEMGEDTRAGLEGAATAEGEAEEEAVAAGPVAKAAGRPRAVVTQVVEYAPDAVSTALSSVLVVALAVMCVAGLGAASMVRGVTPGILEGIYANLGMYAGIAVGVCAIAGGVSYFLAKRSRTS